MTTRRLIVVGMLLLTGCATAGNPQVESDEQIAKVKVGESTREDVRAALGQPASMSLTPRVQGSLATGEMIEQEVWAYSHWRMQARPETFIPIIGPFVGGFDTNSRTLMIYFDQRGVVRYIGHGRTTGVSGPPAFGPVPPPVPPPTP